VAEENIDFHAHIWNSTVFKSLNQHYPALESRRRFELSGQPPASIISQVVGRCVPVWLEQDFYVIL
jgi:hypothetical protein